MNQPTELTGPLHKSFERLLKVVYPNGGIVPEQREQLYNAFFAGALETLNMMQAAAHPSKPDSQSFREVCELADEIMNAAKQIIANAKGRN